MKAPDRYTLMYTPRGHVVHLVHDSQRSSFGEGYWAVCGLVSLTHGTGSWQEYEHAENLPVCKKCQKLAPEAVRQALEETDDG